MKLSVVVLLAFATAPVLASDKGLKAEMVEASVSLFCSSTVADELRPIVARQRKLAISKMSQESLKGQTDELNRLWAALAAKHKAEFAQLGLSARLGSVDPAYVEVAAKEAWTEIQKKCPAKVKSADGPDMVLEFLRRRIPELR